MGEGAFGRFRGRALARVIAVETKHGFAHDFPKKLNLILEIFVGNLAVRVLGQSSFATNRSYLNSFGIEGIILTAVLISCGIDLQL